MGATGLPISRPTGPSIKAASRLPTQPSCLKITRIQKYLLYKTLFYVEQPPSAYHIPPLKKILWKPCMWFFFLWNDMEIIWWNDKKKDDYLWKENMNIANFASVRNSMVPNLNLLSSLTTLAVKTQAQFKEKKIYKMSNTEDQFWL